MGGTCQIVDQFALVVKRYAKNALNRTPNILVHTPVPSNCVLKFPIRRRICRYLTDGASKRFPHRHGHVNQFGLVVCVPKVSGPKHLRADDSLERLEARVVVQTFASLGWCHRGLHHNLESSSRHRPSLLCGRKSGESRVAEPRNSRVSRGRIPTHRAACVLRFNGRPPAVPGLYRALTGAPRSEP